MIWLVELTGYTDASTSRVYRYSNAKYITAASDTSAETPYETRLIDPGQITRTLFDAATIDGRANPRAEVGYGMIRLANIDGQLDSIFGSGTVSFRERQARVLMVADGAAYSTAQVVMVATISQCQLSIDEVVVGLKDRLYELDSPHQTSTYGGTNALPAGVDGTEELRGKVKPLLYGKVFSVEPPCVNTSKLIYQISARELQSVDAVYDGGVALSAGATYADQATMESTAPAAGQYRAWLAGGMVRLGSSPVYALTADATGDAAGSSTAAQLLKTLALARGIASGDISAADVSALDALNSAVLGIWCNDSSTTLDLMDQVARSVGAVYRFDRTGALRMQRFDAPSGAAAASLAAWNIASVEQLQGGEDVPASTVRVRYARYYRAQTAADLAGAVSDADRADLAQEWRTSEVTSTPSPNPHKRLQTIERDTCLTTKADADTEAARLQALTNVARRSHALRNVQLDDAQVLSIDVGSVIGLRWARYGFSADTETLRTVISITSRLAERTCDLTVWGS